MELLFNAAIKISNQLSFKAKFVFVSIVCLVPLAFFFTTLVQVHWQQVEQLAYAAH